MFPTVEDPGGIRLRELSQLRFVSGSRRSDFSESQSPLRRRDAAAMGGTIRSLQRGWGATSSHLIKI